MQASTIESRFRAVELFFDFSRSRYVFVGCSTKAMTAVSLKIKEWMCRLKPLKRRRKVELDEFKLRNLMTRDDFICYGNSNHVQQLEKALELRKGNTTSHCSKKLAISIRNHLILRLCMANACRASNITNVTIEDVLAATSSDDFPNARVIYNWKYKTSLIYGKKAIVMDTGLWNQLVTYLESIRPTIASDDTKKNHLRYAFSSSINVVMPIVRPVAPCRNV